MVTEFDLVSFASTRDFHMGKISDTRKSEARKGPHHLRPILGSKDVRYFTHDQDTCASTRLVKHHEVVNSVLMPRI